MPIDRKFQNSFINVTSRAALSSYFLIGKKDKIGADKAAVDTMRNELNKIDMNGKIVIGEGELDEAPMLYIGENVGTTNGPMFDIAVDPLEGTNFVASNLPGAMSVIAVTSKSNLLGAPETYMNKISANCSEQNVVDLDFSVKRNIYNLAEAKNLKPENLTACVLDRPRHKEIINELKKLNVKLKLISDGDVAGALMIIDKKYSVDIFLGIGGGPEGVLAAAALDAYNCHFQGRFIFNTDKEKERAKKMGITNFDRKYELNEIISGDSIFCATGITSGDIVSGIEINKDKFTSETLITHKSLGLKKIIKTEQII